MKQFRVMNPSTYAWRSVDEGELMSMMSTSTDSLLAQWVPVGGEFTDSDGFGVARNEDVGPGVADPRLERISTAVLTGLAAVPNTSLQLTPDDVRRSDVENAVAYAKALIAELDKQP